MVDDSPLRATKQYSWFNGSRDCHSRTNSLRSRGIKGGKWRHIDSNCCCMALRFTEKDTRVILRSIPDDAYDRSPLLDTVVPPACSCLAAYNRLALVRKFIKRKATIGSGYTLSLRTGSTSPTLQKSNCAVYTSGLYHSREATLINKTQNDSSSKRHRIGC